MQRRRWELREAKLEWQAKEVPEQEGKKRREKIQEREIQIAARKGRGREGYWRVEAERGL